MNYFDFLAVAFAILALVALYQLRPCAVIFAGNNMLVSRALSAIERVGAPASHWYLPRYVFSSENLSTAATILTITLTSLVVITLLFVRKPKPLATDLPAVPRWLLIAIGLYLVALVGSVNTILTGGYAGEADVRYNLELAGGHAFLVAFIMYEVARRKLLSMISGRRGFLIIFAIFAIIGYGKGSTGLTTGCLMTSAFLLLPRAGSASRLANMSRVGGVLLAVVLMSFVVRGVRTKLAKEGLASVTWYLDFMADMEERREETGEGAEVTANAGQTAVHMLECATLYDSGHSREWRSIYNVVQYTFVPGVFVAWFDWTRPLEPAWEISHYFVSGGGMNVLGEFYWNGGYLCVVIMVVALVAFLTVVDLRYLSSPFWLMMVVQFAPSLLMGYSYGFPQVARGAINGLLAAAGYKMLQLLSGAPGRPPMASPSALAGGPAA